MALTVMLRIYKYLIHNRYIIVCTVVNLTKIKRIGLHKLILVLH